MDKMKQFDWVVLVNDKPYLKNNLEKGCFGVILEINEQDYKICFFNEKNSGDTALVSVNKNDVKKDNYNLSPEVDKLLKENYKELLKDKDTLNIIPIQDYDVVEVMVEKERYAKAGVHKGEIGHVMDSRGSSNYILVDFPYVPEEYWGDVLSVDYRDLKILKRHGKEYK